MKVITNFFKQVSALHFYRLAIESIASENEKIMLRIRIRFSGFTYASCPEDLTEDAVKFPPLHAFILGYLFALSKNKIPLSKKQLSLMVPLLNQDEFLIKFTHFLNCRVLHHAEKIELTNTS